MLYKLLACTSREQPNRTEKERRDIILDILSLRTRDVILAENPDQTRIDYQKKCNEGWMCVTLKPVFPVLSAHSVYCCCVQLDRRSTSCQFDSATNVAQPINVRGRTAQTTEHTTKHVEPFEYTSHVHSCSHATVLSLFPHFTVACRP